ncbi:hypothetical protein KC19_2G108200, partial [Ceratodon purpureus]
QYLKYSPRDRAAVRRKMNPREILKILHDPDSEGDGDPMQWIERKVVSNPRAVLVVWSLAAAMEAMEAFKFPV